MTPKRFHNIKLRSELFRSIREYFYHAGYIEVETPIKIHAPAPEEYIESLRAENDFLRSSPELAMKVLLSGGMEKIFQVGKCFRANEFGSRHREEFTMLEYYACGVDYRTLAEFTAEFIKVAAQQLFNTNKIQYQDRQIELAKHEFITVEEAFRRYVGCSVAEAEEADQFDELMVTKIEPRLGDGQLTFLCDYPANRASLARLKASDPTKAERWELYIAGMELANAFGELTDCAEQKARFEAAKEFRTQAKMHPYPDPVEFFAALECGLPESSGSALGLDRLAMIFCDETDISEVLAIT